MTGGGPAARELAWLGWVVLSTFVLTTVVTVALLGWAACRRRGSFAEHAPADAGGGQRWIVIGGFLVPAAVLGVVFVVTLQTMTAFPMGHDPHGGADIRIIGRQWWWEAVYERGPVHRRVRASTEIHIPVGRPVTLALESRDVIHSFWVPKLHGKVDLVPGRTNHIRLQADEPGVYRGQCAEFCGMQHAHMAMLVVAEPEAEFEAWLERQRRPAARPATAAAVRGQRLFESRACVVCHQVRGTAALATVGPDLTHVASRRLIAGGMLRNNTANMYAWVTHAQSLKPGSWMPDVTQFTGAELHDLVAYLQGLE